jgi:type I restriction-modification system DNA methylase subunit
MVPRLARPAEIDLEGLASSIAALGARDIREEKLKIETEKLLSSYLGAFVEKIDPSYEYTFISGERVDALYGHVIIEYESPGAIATASSREHAIGQAKKYIRQAAKVVESYHKFFGVALDGRQIVFVRFVSSKRFWSVSKAVEVNTATIGRLVEAIRALHKKPLDAKQMVVEFGPTGKIALPFVKQLYTTKIRSPRAKTLYDDWRRVFQQVAGYSVQAMKGLEKIYVVDADADYEKLLFSIHTYYSILMKLVSAELVVLYGGGKFAQSFIDSLLGAESEGKLRERLNEVEDGTLFENLDYLSNLTEGDYFSWYLDEWSKAVHDEVKELIRAVSDYEVGTADLEPERVRDLFKSLYQDLVPREVRLKMGEFYTPDWLAELVLDEAGFTLARLDAEAKKSGDSKAPLNLRLLDPSCGSGTFLLQAISRLKQYAENHFIDPKLLAEMITTNVVGYDLNPLAVIAARTNYLLALGDLVRHMRGREIPVFLADSIMIEERSTLKGRNFILRTVVGQFSIPSGVIEKGLLGKTLTLLRDCVAADYPTKDFIDRVKREVPGFDDQELEELKDLFDRFRHLEREHKNRIWAGIIKNSFAPLYQRKFDFVVGNPPWISWDNLPGAYRETLGEAWENLWSTFGLGNELSNEAFKKDISALFTASCFAKYKKDDGVLAFLLTFTLFKAQSGGAFRSFLARVTDVQVVHDLVSTRPFEGATNRTSLLVVHQGKTTFPVRAVSWKAKRGVVDFHATLGEAKRATDRKKLVMEPIEGPASPASSWMMLPAGALAPLRKAIGASALIAQEGINTRGANGIFYVRVLEEKDGLVLVENMNEEGRTKTDQKQFWVESDLLFPLLRGKDVERSHSAPSSHIIVPNDPRTGELYIERDLRVKFPNTWKFFLYFKERLASRTHYGKPLPEAGIPFYTLFQVNDKVFAPYKVVWKEIAGEISGKGDLAAAAVTPLRLGDGPAKPPIPDHKLMMVPFNSEDAAYFTAAVLNSSLARLVVASYTIETSISTHVLKYVRAPLFDPREREAVALAALGKRQSKHPEDTNVSREVDVAVAKSFGITPPDMRLITESLKLLMD